jgi:hypothetical protein
MARIVYGMVTREEEPMTPEEVTAAFSLPVEAVQEAIAYCLSDPPEIKQDWEREEANIKARAQKTWFPIPPVVPLTRLRHRIASDNLR